MSGSLHRTVGNVYIDSGDYCIILRASDCRYDPKTPVVYHRQFPAQAKMDFCGRFENTAALFAKLHSVHAATISPVWKVGFFNCIPY